MLCDQPISGKVIAQLFLVIYKIITSVKNAQLELLPVLLVIRTTPNLELLMTCMHVAMSTETLD